MLFCFCLPESLEKAGEAGKLSVKMALSDGSIAMSNFIA
jgi:hypothetical protein